VRSIEVSRKSFNNVMLPDDFRPHLKLLVRMELEFVEVWGNFETLEELQEMLPAQCAPGTTESYVPRFQERDPIFLDALVHPTIHEHGH